MTCWDAVERSLRCVEWDVNASGSMQGSTDMGRVYTHGM